MQRRVVITGMGIWSCIGQNLKTVTESLRLGGSGIGVREERRQYGYHSLLTGLVPKPDLKGLLDRRQRNTLSEEAEYAYMATCEALKNAGIDEIYCKNNEIGVVYGNDSSNQAVVDAYLRAREEQNTMMLGSGPAFRAMTSNVTSNLAVLFNFRGVNLSTASACASSAQAIAIAAMFIKCGQADVIIAGGAQETNDISMIAFDGVNTLSKRNDNPTGASRPFDKRRDGLVPSGGAATLVLEEYGHAIARGATIFAEIAGYGFSQNAAVLGQPSVESECLAMSNALKNAEMSPCDINYINAHATSTISGDMAEGLAIAGLFGEKTVSKIPYVSSTKSMTGHECWMAGASEAVYSILMMQNGFVAPNINIEEPDDFAKVLNIVRQTIYQSLNTIMSNSFGFGGSNCSLIFKKYQL